MKIKLDSNGFIKNNNIIHKILNVPKYTILFGSLLSAVIVGNQISQEKVDLPDAKMISELIGKYKADDYFISSSHTGNYAENYNLEPDTFLNIKNELNSLLFNITKSLNSDTKYTRFEIPKDYGTIKVYVDKDFSDEKVEAVKNVYDEWNEFFAERNSAYKFEVVKGIPLSSFLDPYNIKIVKKSSDFRSCVTNLPIGKNGEVTQIGFNVIHMADISIESFTPILRHETGHTHGLGDSYVYTEEENYFDGLMGGQQEYDMNTMKLIDALFSINDSKLSIIEKENLIFDFVKKYGEYKSLITIADDFENKNADMIENISETIGPINFKFENGKEYTYIIKGSNPFDLFRTNNADKTLVVSIKNGRISIYQQNFSIDQDSSCLSKIDTDLIKTGKKMIVNNELLIIESFIVGQVNGDLIFISPSNYAVRVVEAELVEKSFDEVVEDMEREKSNFNYLDSIRGDGLTYYQARVVDAIKNNFTLDYFVSQIRYKPITHSKLGSKLEFNFDLEGEYNVELGDSTETLVFGEGYERYNESYNFITDEKEKYKSENGEVVKSYVIMFSNNKFIAKCGEYYFEVGFKYSEDKIEFTNINIMTKTSTYEHTQTIISESECSVD
ncbi:MAG: hypothetical protein PHP83_01860 [Clostridia bacterium]|nr:hypothetical protein [Clostridia bacterium]